MILRYLPKMKKKEKKNKETTIKIVRIFSCDIGMEFWNGKFALLIMKKNTRLDMTGWEKRSIGNCARHYYLTTLTNGVSSNQNLS